MDKWNRLRVWTAVLAIGLVAAAALAVSGPWAALAGALALTAVAATALIIESRREDHRARTLLAALGKLAQGEFDSPPAQAAGELGVRLHDALESVRERLRDNTITRDYLGRLLSSMSEAVLITDPQGRVLRSNPAADEMLGYPEGSVFGIGIEHLLASEKLPSDSAPPNWANPRESIFFRRDGSTLAVSYTVSDLQDDHGKVEGRVYTAQNIGERKRAEQRIRYLARIDPLTKMSNRMQFQHQLQQALARARKSRQYMSILYLDVDRFKDINDTFGHAAGDTSLEIFARRVNAELAEQAIAGRLAGDEFSVLITGCQQMSELVAKTTEIAGRLLAAVGRPFQIQGEELFLTASVGIAVYPRDGDNVVELLRNADAALYHAKKAGGNCFEFYSADMNTAAVERLMLKGKLRRALERDELTVHYQPKYGLRTGRIEGVEALLRWDLPERGLVPPSDFIPLAEETNLILQLGDWVLNRVCQDYRQWQRALPVPVRVSVNLSLRQLQQQRFIERVQTIFRTHGVSPAYVELEITETTLMEDIDRTIRILDSLYGMGLHLAIDDFGTGYSSLSALQQFPIGTLKIDQSFVRDIPGDSDDAAIVETIIKMAHSLQMEVVAEGVESQAQLDFLRQQGCDYVQGRLFGDPMKAEAFLDLLLAQSEGTLKHRALFA
jgi:diguanylate cyclase (GGDEF)-like protein/PAS domain S-box-containing protein